MLDNLREQASTTSYFEEEVPSLEEIQAPRLSSSRFLGMTVVQRFILALMLLVAICALGTMFLLITGKILPPFLY